MNEKSRLGLIAVILSVISTISMITGYSLSSNYHCDDPAWLAKSEWKNGAYPAIAPDIELTPKQACLSVSGNIMMMSFFLGMMMPWFVFAMMVGIWKQDIADDEFEKMPNVQNLCQIHFNEITSKYRYNKFQIRYLDNLGKCGICGRDAKSEFIKDEIPKTEKVE